MASKSLRSPLTTRLTRSRRPEPRSVTPPAIEIACSTVMSGSSVYEPGVRTNPVTKKRSALGTKIVSPSRMVTFFDKRPVSISRRLTRCTSASRARAWWRRRARAVLGVQDQLFAAGLVRAGAGLCQRLNQRDRAGQHVLARRARLAHHEHALAAELLHFHRHLRIAEIAVGEPVLDDGRHLGQRGAAGFDATEERVAEMPSFSTR